MTDTACPLCCPRCGWVNTWRDSGCRGQAQQYHDDRDCPGRKPRNPLGVRGFEHHWIGDQRPEPVVTSPGATS